MNDFSYRLIAAPQSPEHSAWQAFGLWMRLAAVGACVGVISVTLLIDRAAALGSGLLWLAIGATVGVFGARRAMTSLRRAENVSTPARVSGSTAIAHPHAQPNADSSRLSDLAAAASMLR